MPASGRFVDQRIPLDPDSEIAGSGRYRHMLSQGHCVVCERANYQFAH